MTPDEHKDMAERTLEDTMPGHLFQALRTELEDRCDDIMIDRAKKYEGPNDDRLDFFHRIAVQAELHPVQVHRVLIEKHLANIESMRRDAIAGRLSRSFEEILEPFIDSRNYYDFLLGLLLLANQPPHADE